MSLHSDRENTAFPQASILRFPRRRGRPRGSRPHHDTGTPELIYKRLKGETAEALDLCLERGIITRDQHWCGVHLRWLYTLRYGAPGVRAVDPTHLGGVDIKPDDPEWRAAREKEYHDVIRELNLRGHALPILNLCIYNERPRFLSPATRVTSKRANEIGEMITRLCDGLDILMRHWQCADERGS